MSTETLDLTYQELDHCILTIGSMTMIEDDVLHIVLTVCSPHRPELVAVMTAVGNETSWRLLEAKNPKNKPSPNSSV